jgi:hypothetical protein
MQLEKPAFYPHGRLGRFPFEQKTEFAFLECPVAKWNATA